MQHKGIIIAYVIVSLIGAAVVYRIVAGSGSGAPVSPQASGVSSQSQWESKSDDQANVTVIVKPLDLRPESKVWTFDIGMNTHSVELNQDMTKIAVLVDDTGKEYQPLGWEGDAGGHHREGTLSFSSISPTPKSVTLRVSGIADVVRTFTWSI